MSPIALKVAQMVDMLPESEQLFAEELVRKLVVAWDPDYTKVTPQERKEIEEAEKSGFIPEEKIDWDNLWKYAD